MSKLDRLAPRFAAGLVALSIALGVGLPAATAPVEAAGQVVARDGFTRNSSSTWGRAAAGGRYSVSRGARWSVDGSTGYVSLRRPGSAFAMLRGATTRDADLRVTVRPGRAALGDRLRILAIARQVGTGTRYEAQVVSRRGQLSVSIALRTRNRVRMLASARPIGYTIDATTRLNLRLRVTGGVPTSISFKAWPVGTSEPEWQAEAQSRVRRLARAGGVGVGVVAPIDVGRFPARVGFDDVRVTRVRALRVAAVGPTIRNVRVTGIQAGRATIRWTLSEPGTGVVQFGTSGYDRQSTKERTFRYTQHVQTITGLRPGTTYRFRVRSVNRAGAASTSGERTFRTTAAAPATNPNPGPATNPTPRPATGNTHNVPASIDSTGGSDASAALNSFLASVPNGSTIVFRKDGTYRMDHGLRVRNRHRLVFEGNGATLSSNPRTATNEHDSLFALQGGNTDITIRDFHFVGNSPNPGVYTGVKEGVHAVMVQGDRIEIHDVTVRGMYGDAFFIHESGTSTGWSSDVWIHDSRVYSTGRNGVTIIAGQDVVIERVAFDKSGYCTFDIEPNNSSQGARRITFRNNTAGTFSNSFFSGEGARNSVVDGVTVTGNTVTGDSLLTIVRLSTGRRNIAITNNTSRVTVRGPVLYLSYITGLTVTGNTQPMSSGQIADIRSSTGVTYQP